MTWDPTQKTIGAPSLTTRDVTGSNQVAVVGELADEEGPIPTFPPLQLDEFGRIIPISDDERRARMRAASRVLAAFDKLPDEDAPDSTAKMMRNIDAERPPGEKLFELKKGASAWHGPGS